MQTYQETFETWNKVAGLYEEKFMDLEIYNATYDRFCEALGSDHARVLEIGCGPGNITRYLLSKIPELSILGIDVAPDMIALAAKNNPTAQFLVMDAREIDRIEPGFDGIVCGFCVPYLSESDCRKMFIDCRNLLTENGVLYLSFVEGDPVGSGFQSNKMGDRVYFYFHELEGLEKQLAEAGFKSPEVFRVNYPKGDGVEVHTILLTEKID